MHRRGENAPETGHSREDGALSGSWRRLIPQATGDEGIPLALGVELRQRDAYDPGRWEPRGVQAVTPRALAERQDGLSLAVRPLVPGARGGWIRGDVSWDLLRRAPERYRGAHARWFADLHGIAAAMRASGPFTAVSEWLTLDAVASPHLWPHLAAAAETGIPIVATHPQQLVRLADSAAIAVALSETPDNGMRMRADVRIDETAHDPRLVRPVGDAGVYAVEQDRDPIPVVMAPVALPDPLPGLLGVTEVRVPAAERAAFERELYPVLATRTRVVAPGIALPAVAASILRIAVEFRPSHTVSYAFTWERPGGAPAPFAAAESDAETALADAVVRSWADASRLPFAPAAILRDAEAAEFSTRVLTALEDLAGVRVDLTGERPRYRELTGDPSVSVTTVAGPDPDWFDLGVVVTIEGRTIPFGALFAALSRGRRRMMLADGAYFSLAHPALQRLKELLEEAESLAEWETGPRIARTQLALWDDFEDLADRSAPAQEWRELVDGLRDTEAVPPTPLPAGLTAELRPYQRAGYAWLAFLWRAGLGGILADDMGLGKTLQTLALIAHARQTGETRPFLVVAPTSVRDTWVSEAARFLPGLDVRIAAATARRRGASVAEIAGGADLVVTSYAVLRLDADEFAATSWGGVILDEAQFVKNPRTRLHQAVAALPARMTLAITGTPLENSLTDLWALLSLTAPGLFPSARRFREEYLRPIEQAPDAASTESSAAAAARARTARLERLRRRIRPLVLRRTKERVAPELPPRQEQDLRVELAPGHRAYYDTVLQRERQKVLGLLDDLDRNRFIVFRSLTLLRMLSLAPALVDPAAAHLGSSKLDALLERLGEVIAEGHRALVFSQFTSFLALAAERLDAAGIRYASLDGATARRPEVVDGFREGDAPVFLISLKAGGFGLTLIEADYVFVLDPWWNPAAEAQAVDRTHRIGQTRTVFVYRMLAAGTIEEKVAALQRRKAGLFRAVLDEGDPFARALDAADIRGLLEA